MSADQAALQIEQAVKSAANHVAEAHAVSSEIPEIPNAITLLNQAWHGNPFVSWLHHWENLVFSAIIGALLCFFALRFARRPAAIPRGGQNLFELFVEAADRFVCGVIGPSGRNHSPFIGTLFIYIWLLNLSVLVPGMKSSTSSLNTTIGLAIVVFCYVQVFRVRTMGIIAYLHHMAGSPRFDDLASAPILLKPVLLFIKLIVAVLLFCLELIGEFVKPASLSLRLGFNIFAEDVLLAVLVGLGIAAGFAIQLPSGPFMIGLPLQLFVVPLVLIFSTVQALVFSLLSTVYIGLMAPHESIHAVSSGEAPREH